MLPVARADAPVLEPSRAVGSDVDDFVRFVATLAASYFVRPNYATVGGRCYLSIYDATFFVKELGTDGARAAIAAARAWLRAHGHRDLHLAAIEPNDEVLPLARSIGFDSVTHYVLLPDWRGPLLQDYRDRAAVSAARWPAFAAVSGLPYMPAVATGWDASPRGVDFGDRRPDKYPWSPVVTGEHPEHFAAALRAAHTFRSPAAGVDDPLVLVASLNEWSEGHYLEPDERFGHGWLEAVRAARQ